MDNIEKRVMALNSVKLSPQDETDRKGEMFDEMDSIAVIVQELELWRERAAVVARKKDIDYVSHLDEVIETILSTLAENKEDLAKSIVGLIKSGNTRLLKELMVALGISIDKREMLLGFDTQRRNKKETKKMKFEVLWKGSDGTQAGVKIEEV